MFFVSDDKLGCVDENFFYTYNTVDKMSALYDYQNNNSTNLIDDYPAKADSMRMYGMSMMTTANYILKKKFTRAVVNNKE